MSRCRFAVSMLAGACALASAGPTSAFDSGSTGADGPFNPTTNLTLTIPPSGVFNFTTITIPSGVTVRFAHNADNTPVTLLAQGDVRIDGVIDVRGNDGAAGTLGTGLAPNGGTAGPGGGAGGAGSNALLVAAGGSGLGPGGGAGGVELGCCAGGGGGAGFAAAGAGSTVSGTPASSGGAAYGGATLLPLLAGSGGGGGSARVGATGGGGGGGGGAILIATSGTLTFSGTIDAHGGHGGQSTGCFPQSPFAVIGPGGGGSGGGVRLVATTITGAGGSIDVTGGPGGIGCQGDGGAGSIGRIRVEAGANTSTIRYLATPSLDQPGIVSLPDGPSLRIMSVGGRPVPAGATGLYATPDIVFPVGTTNPIVVSLAASNVPVGTPITVTVSGLVGGSTSVTVPLAGTPTSATATATVSIPLDEPSVISASASFTVASAGSDGDPPDGGGARVHVAAVAGSPLLPPSGGHAADVPLGPRGGSTERR
jgi:hypothetical protein